MSDRERHESEQEEKKVKVVDRRRFVMDESGDVVERPDAPREERSAHKIVTPEPPPPTPAPTADQDIQPPASGEESVPPAPAPESASEEDQVATKLFLEFLNSLAHSMLVHLGEVPDPGSGLVRENLDGARQTLEMLGVLRKKTDGNLTPQEVHMFDSLLYELMMRFRQKAENIPNPGAPQ